MLDGSSLRAACAYAYGFTGAVMSGTDVALSGTNTYLIWQKCSVLFSKRVVFVRFSMRNTPSTLLISDGCGHTSFSQTRLLPVVSCRGSRANVASAIYTSEGRLTSTKSPGQTVMLVGGARSTWAQRTACLLRILYVVSYVYVVPSARVMIRLAGRMVMSLTSINGVPASISTSRFCTTSPQNWNVLFLRAMDMVASPTVVSDDDPSAW